MADRQILGLHENKPLRAVLRLSNGVLQINPENRLCGPSHDQAGPSGLDAGWIYRLYEYTRIASNG